MDNEEIYTEALEFQIAGASGEPPINLTWDPETGIGSGDDFKDTLALTSLDYFMRTYDEEYNGEYSVTPEGPTFQTNPKDLRMVVWSINQLFEGGIVSASGEYPTLASMGLTDASNYDANGREIIR